jgi:hypothetical protein
MRKEAFLFEKINRYNDKGRTIIELSISNGDAEWNEEFEEMSQFEREEYVEVRFFNEDGSEITDNEFHDTFADEFEEADWETEYITNTLEEAKAEAKLYIDELKDG